MYCLHDADTIDSLPFENDCLRIPDGPGFGVEVNEAKLGHDSVLHTREGATRACWARLDWGQVLTGAQ